MKKNQARLFIFEMSDWTKEKKISKHFSKQKYFCLNAQNFWEKKTSQQSQGMRNEWRYIYSFLKLKLTKFSLSYEKFDKKIFFIIAIVVCSISYI